jgi:hypothetical protein
MSTQPIAAGTGVGSQAAGRSAIVPAPGRVRVRIVQAVLALGSAAVIGFLLVRPGPARTDLSYPAVAAGRDAAWWGHLVECVGYGAAGIGLALAVGLLVRGRGATWANAGGVLVALGGVLFAAMGYTIAVVSWYATSPGGIGPAAGAALLDDVRTDPGHFAAADVLGFVTLTLGSLLIAVALWRSGSVPRWVPISLAVLTLAQFAPWPDRAFDVEQAVLMGVFLVVAWFAGRRPASAVAEGR